MTIAFLAIISYTSLSAQYNTNAGKNRAYNQEVQQVAVKDDEGQQVLDEIGNAVFEEKIVEVAVA